MANKSFKADLSSCISAGVAAVAVTSHEWERVAAAVYAVSFAKGTGQSRWDALNGLVIDGETVPGSNTNPVAALQAVSELKDSIVLFENFNDRLKIPAVISQMRGLLQYAKCNGVCMVFLSTSGEFPLNWKKKFFCWNFLYQTKRKSKECSMPWGTTHKVSYSLS